VLPDGVIHNTFFHKNSVILHACVHGRREDFSRGGEFGKANRVLSERCCFMFTKWVHLITAKLLVFKLDYAPIFTYAHESCLLTGRLLSQVQAAEMRFLRRSHCVTLRDEVESSEIRKTLNVDPLFRIQRSQLRLCGQVTRMPQERLAMRVMQATPTEKWSTGRSRTSWLD